MNLKNALEANRLNTDVAISMGTIDSCILRLILGLQALGIPTLESCSGTAKDHLERYSWLHIPPALPAEAFVAFPYLNDRQFERIVFAASEMKLSLTTHMYGPIPVTKVGFGYVGPYDGISDDLLALRFETFLQTVANRSTKQNLLQESLALSHQNTKEYSFSHQVIQKNLREQRETWKKNVLLASNSAEEALEFFAEKEKFFLDNAHGKMADILPPIRFVRFNKEHKETLVRGITLAFDFGQTAMAVSGGNIIDGQSIFMVRKERAPHPDLERTFDGMLFLNQSDYTPINVDVAAQMLQRHIDHLKN